MNTIANDARQGMGRVGSAPIATGAAALALAAKRKAARQRSDRFIETLLLLAACVSVFTTVGILYILISESIASPLQSQWGLRSDSTFNQFGRGFNGSLRLKL